MLIYKFIALENLADIFMLFQWLNIFAIKKKKEKQKEKKSIILFLILVSSVWSLCLSLQNEENLWRNGEEYCKGKHVKRLGIVHM